MDKWRKSLAARTTHHATAASSTSSRRTAKEETTMLLNLKRQMNKESSNMGSMWRPRVLSAKKSIPRRLSYSKHDDSLSLMNIGNRLDESMKSSPVCLETASSVNISKYGAIKKKTFDDDDDDEELGVKKETLDYLKSIGVIGNSDSKLKSKAPLKTVEFTPLLPKVKELLVKQRKEKSELRERYERDMNNMENDHEEELIALFNIPEKMHTTEPVTLDVPSISVTENGISQEIKMLEDSFLKSPCSGAWRVSHLGGDDDSFSNNTPTLCLNTVSNVTINHQQFLETPATRRLVTQKILKGIENLFVE